MNRSYKNTTGLVGFSSQNLNPSFLLSFPSTCSNQERGGGGWRGRGAERYTRKGTHRARVCTRNVSFPTTTSELEREAERRRERERVWREDSFSPNPFESKPFFHSFLFFFFSLHFRNTTLPSHTLRDGLFLAYTTTD